LYAQNLAPLNVPSTTVLGFDTDPGMSITFDIINNSNSNTIYTRASKTELSVVQGTDNSFCWGGNCFSPSTFTSPNTVELSPNTQTSSTCFFDDNNPNDNTCIDVTYDAAFTSVSNQNKASSYLGGSTFVSRKKMNTFNYRLVDAKNATINLVNMLGVTVKTYPISSQQGVVLMNAGDLKSGVYFMTLNVNGKRVSNKKVIVE
jgi:hypothetical protein